MEKQFKVLCCDKLYAEQILTILKEQLAANFLDKVVLVRKRVKSKAENRNSKLPSNAYRKQIIEEKIEKLYDQLRQKIDEIGEIEAQATPMNMVGKLQDLYRQEKYQQIIQRVMKHAESDYYVTSEPDVTFILGNCFFKLHKYQEAIQYYLIKSEDQNIRQKANRLNNLATCLAQTNQNQQSLKIYTQALKYYIQIPELDQSNLLFNIGTLYKNSMMFEKAEEFYCESLIERQNKSPYNEKMLYDTHVELGKVQKQLGKHEESLGNYLLGMNYCKKNTSINPIKALTELCLIYQKLEKWGEALSYYEFLSDQYERRDMNQGYIYEKVAKIHHILKNYIRSANFLKKSFLEYRKQGNERKMSDISSSLLAAEEYSKLEMERDIQNPGLSPQYT